MPGEKGGSQGVTNNIKSSSTEKIVLNLQSGFKEKNSANFSHVFFPLYKNQVITQYWHHLVSDLIKDESGDEDWNSFLDLFYRFTDKYSSNTEIIMKEEKKCLMIAHS